MSNSCPLTSWPEISGVEVFGPFKMHVAFSCGLKKKHLAHDHDFQKLI